MTFLQPEVFVYSRWRIVALLLVSSVFVAIALLVPPTNPSDNWNVLGGGFFGLCSVVFVCLLVRPQRLALDAEGFTLAGGLMPRSREKKIRWIDVDGFSVFATGRGNKLIAFNFSSDATERTRLSRFNHAAFGLDGALPGGWPGGAGEMAQHLNDYRERALRAANEYGA